MASQRLDAGSRIAGAPPMRDLASTAQLCEALGVVEAQGWDSPTGAAVLQYAQVRVVRRLVSLRGFSGHAIEEAVVTGMSVAWEVLDGTSVRQAARPWGVVWRAVDRALSGEILADRFQCSRNRAWRVAADAGPGDGVLFVDDPHQIEGAVTAAGSPQGDPTGLGPLLDALTSAMVDAGWDRWDAEAVVGATVGLAGQPPSDGRTVLGWRPVAQRFGIPPWRVRRALLALLGTETESGILRSLVENGPRILQQESVAEALRATTVRWGVPRVSACANAESPAAQPEGASIAC
jgi:hypothetical protein